MTDIEKENYIDLLKIIILLSFYGFLGYIIIHFIIKYW
jgi:hypothetical protein